MNASRSTSRALVLMLIGTVAGTAGIAAAADHPHPGQKDVEKRIVVKPRIEKKVERHVRSRGDWTDGEFEVNTTVDDGHIKVVVNGDVVFEGDISDVADVDLGDIKLHKLGGALLLLRDGEQIMKLDGSGSIAIGGKVLDLDNLKRFSMEKLEDLEDLDWADIDIELDGDQLRRFVGRAGEGGNAFFFAPEADADHPPVMLGIRIGSGEQIAERLHALNLDEDEVTVVMQVIEGLPAARSGLKDNDIIIEIDGDDDAGTEHLMELLRRREPGDEIELKVLREGRPREIVVELAPFEGERLGFSVAPGAPGQFRFAPNQFRFAPEFNELIGPEHAKEIAKLSERMGELAAELAEASADERAEIGRKMAELGERMGELASEAASGFIFNAPEGGQWRFSLPRFELEELEDGQRGYVIVEPDEDDQEVEADDADARSNERRIRELEQKIRRLERLLREQRDRDGDV